MNIANYISYNYKIFLKEAKLFSPLHRGINYGDGVYETLKAYDGGIFTFDEHLKRLKNNLKTLKINFQLNPQRIKREIKKLLKINRWKDCAIRIVITRGSGLGVPPEKTTSPDIMIMLFEIDPKIVEYQKNGAHAIIISIPRSYEPSIRNSKTLNFLPNVLGSLEVKEKGAYEGIFLTRDGFLAEGTTSNVFFVKNGKVKTPHLDTGILPGITREILLKIMKKKGIPFEEGFYTKEELLEADEVFITSTTREIVPIVRINKKIIGNGKRGDLTKLLQQLFKEEVPSHLTF